MKLLILFLLAADAYGQQVTNGGRTFVGPVNGCTDAGANDAYACNMGLPAYATNTCYTFKANTANTGAASINFDSLGAKTIKKAAGGVTTDLADNDIRAGQTVSVCYDGTNMQMQSTLGNAPDGGGGGALTSNSGDSPWMPWGLARFSADLNTIISNGDTQLYALGNDISKQFREFGFMVIGAAASGKGMVISIYTRASNGDLTRIALSSGVLVDSTGNKYVTWVSGSAVSSGLLTLPAGQNLYIGMTLDSSAGAVPSIRFYDEAGTGILDFITKTFAGTLKPTAAASSSSSGTGTSVTSPSTIVNASYAVVNEYRPMIAFFP